MSKTTTKFVTLSKDSFTGATCSELLRHIYVEWMNNYLSIELFAEHHEMTVKDAKALIELGRSAMKMNDKEGVR